MNWCKECVTGFSHVSISNFGESFRDGLAFCAIVARYFPAPIISKPSPKKSEEALNHAFATAHKCAEVPMLLDPLDFKQNIDEMSVIIYLIVSCHQFLDKNGLVFEAIAPIPVRQTYNIKICFRGFSTKSRGASTDIFKSFRLAPFMTALEIKSIISRTLELQNVIIVCLENNNEISVSDEDQLTCDKADQGRQICVKKIIPQKVASASSKITSSKPKTSAKQSNAPIATIDHQKLKRLFKK